jgi:hypothetical protein
MKRKHLTLLNYFYLAFIFIWQSLRLTIFGGIDGKGRIVIIASLIIFLINITNSKSFGKSLFSKSSILKYWVFWLIYAVINTVLKYDTPAIPLYSFIGVVLFTPFVVMSIIVNVEKNEISRFLMRLQNIIFVSFLILFLFAKKEGGRLSIELFDPNELSLLVNFLVVIISIRYIRKEIKLSKLLLLLILPTYYIIFSGSRMAFGSFVILIFGLFFSFTGKMGVIKILKYLLLFSTVLILFFFIVENTVLGERLIGTIDQSSESSVENPAEGTIFEYYGDRGVYYVLSWGIFLKHIFFGIGLRNFIHYWSTVNHVEFMIQLSELGLIGFALYTIFNSIILKSIFKLKKSLVPKQKAIYRFLLFVFFSIMFSASVLFLYSSIAVAALYGLMILLTTKHSAKIFKVCKE